MMEGVIRRRSTAVGAADGLGEIDERDGPPGIRALSKGCVAYGVG